MGNPIIWFGNAVKFLKDQVLFATGNGHLRAINENTHPNQEGYILIEPDNIYLEAGDSTTPDLKTFFQLQNNGMIETKGAVTIQYRQYTVDFTEFESGYNGHNVTFVPTINPTLDRNKVGSSFYIINNTLSSFTIDQNDIETFNGNTSFIVAPKQMYHFIINGTDLTTGEYSVTNLGNILVNVNPNDSSKIAAINLDPVSEFASISVEKTGLYAGLDFSVSNNFAEIYNSGANRYNQISYSGPTTALTAGYDKHLFNADPVTSVEINSTEVGDLVIIGNYSGVNITIIPGGSETFNGASSIVLTNNTTYLFINANDGQYKVV